jgi:hypothetical protein
MTSWRYTIELNRVLALLDKKFDLTRVEKSCPRAVKRAIADELDKAPPLSQFANKIRAAKSIAEVNRLLDAIYDAADTSGVWCGLGVA